MKDNCEVITVEESSGNVFADLGCPNPDESLAKANIVLSIRRAIKDQKLTQAAAAQRLGIDQPSVSKLMRGQHRGFSTDRLFKFLMALNQDVEISIRPAAGRCDGEHAHGTISVVVA